MNRHLISATTVRSMKKTPNRLAKCIAAACALAANTPVLAYDFQFGDEWSGSVDTNVSYGVSMRLQSQDQDLIGKANLNPAVGQLTNAAQRTAPGRWSVNTDDGNLLYDKHDLFSNAFKITSELSINHGENWGGFLRASYFYDFENADREDISDLAKEKVGKDFKILDAFLFHNFELADNEGTVRLGQQVVSWGESTFIQNGINTVNPVDVSKLRVAGAELKEAFLPVNMVWGSYSFNENLSMEALYLFEFEQTEPDPAGTYFSTNDFATLGGSYVMLGFGTAPQPVRNPDLYWDACFSGGPTDTGYPPVLTAAGCGASLPRAPDRYPGDGGQYGLAFRYFSPALNDTEFGFYFLNYHSRLPLISGRSVTSTALNSGRYFIEYPEDIELYGISFNTTLGESGIALQGEVSYRDNVPLQIDDVEILFAGLSPLNVLIAPPYLRFGSQLGQVPPGAEIRGWERHEMSQWQFTMTKVFGNVMGAEQVAAVAEFGGTKVWDLPAPEVLRYNGDGTDTGGGGDALTGVGRNPITQVDGFPTPYSWGYRLALRADYSNAFGSPVNISPRIAYNQDVNGITPGPGGNFIEGRRSFTLGAEANYLNEWTADLSYTRFYGAGPLNLIRDRDFLSFSVRYSF